MPTLTFEAARECVVEQVTRNRTAPAAETVPLAEAAGRILAGPVFADRDYPATARSIRDGYAVRAGDTPGRLRLIGEVRAGQTYSGDVSAGECVAIMTGAPVPQGADAVVMIEHTGRDGDFVTVPEAPAAQFINAQGAEARAGEMLLEPGRRIGYAEVALLASVGVAAPAVYARPRVAILPTGDEVVALDAAPLPYQVRNSNAHALAAQVRGAGGAPVLLPVAPDALEATRELIEQALDCELLLLSGGVSAGKYDVVEQALASLGASFYFDRVLIQPGQPLVFGRVGRTFFFGLPGNPASTLVTFEIFARAAVELLGGATEPVLPFTLARLTERFQHRRGLTRFLPARLHGTDVAPVPWRGSSDIPAMARANALLVADADRDCWEAGDLIRVLLK
jgi:molybdopterin molybdotransferase